MRRRPFARCLLPLTLAFLLGAPPAWAAVTPITRRSAIGGDVYWWSARRSGSVIALVPFFHYEIVRNVYFDAQLPFAPYFGPTTSFGLGNPTAGAHYAASIFEDRITFFIGGRASIPLASVDSRGWQNANAAAATGLVYYDTYLWAIDYFPFGATAGIEANPVDPLWLRATVDPTFYVPTRRVRHFEGIIQNRFEAELQSAVGVGGGLGFQAVLEGIYPGDNAQFAAEPFFSFDNDKFFLRAGLLVALDRPLGFGFDRGKVATLHINIGGDLK